VVLSRKGGLIVWDTVSGQVAPAPDYSFALLELRWMRSGQQRMGRREPPRLGEGRRLSVPPLPHWANLEADLVAQHLPECLKTDRGKLPEPKTGCDQSTPWLVRDEPAAKRFVYPAGPPGDAELDGTPARRWRRIRPDVAATQRNAVASRNAVAAIFQEASSAESLGGRTGPKA
jgi:hypothetical protein